MSLLASLRSTFSNMQLYGLVSTSLFVWTLLSAFRQRSNFYSAAVYLSKSNACMMILWNQGIYQLVLLGKLMQKVFFGELRMVEVERLQERGWFAVTETLLALTIFKDEFDSSFVLLFVSLLFLKVFHWLAGDRVEMMEQSAHIPRKFHVRMVGLLSLLWIVDVALVLFAVESILLEGPTVMIMFANEYMILLATVANTTLKYGVNAIDSRSEVAWEDKSIYVFYIDLVTDFFKLLTYLTFFCLILTFYGLPLNILRDVYITFRSFVVKCRDLGRYRQATRNMDSLYPNVSAEEMTAMVDKTCIICREDMEYRPVPGEIPVVVPGETGDAVPPVVPPPARTGPNDTPKKLPCGHSFHFHCLRSWLERQQSCPTCRRSVLPEELTRAQVAAAAQAARGPPPPLVNGEDAIRQAQINLARNLGRDAFAVVFPGVAFPPEAALPAGAPIPPPIPTPTIPLPNADQTLPPPPTTTPPTPRITGATTPVRADGRMMGAGRGVNLENPLARFSLPQLQLPPAGEAGLYSAPATGSSQPATSYAGIAYGAYPTRVGRAGRVATALPTNLRPNLEERLAIIRSRMDTTTTPAPVMVVTPPAPAPPTPIASTSTVELSVREAALAAAERRAASMAPASSSVAVPDSPVSPLSLATPDPTTSIPVTPTLAIPPPASSASTSQLYPAPTTSPSYAALPASSYPRLIPLFDPASPRSTTQYPELLASMPPALAHSLSTTPSSLATTSLLPASPTDAQMAELARMTRRGLEERLRVLVGFQDRMEALARDMQNVLNVLPDDSSEVERDQGEEGKGKRATEGVNAVECT